MITTFNNGSKWGCLKSSRYKADAELLNAEYFLYATKSIYLLYSKVICIKRASLIPTYLFILALDFSSIITTENISKAIVCIYSPAGISNPKKTENYSNPRKKSPYSRKQYGVYFMDITKNNWFLFSSLFTSDSITHKTNAIYNINPGVLVRK